MWVSRRTDYATRAILALSLEGGGPLKLEALARRTAVPQSGLEQVMPTMRTAGIVRPERGTSGGDRSATRTRGGGPGAGNAPQRRGGVRRRRARAVRRVPAQQARGRDLARARRAALP